DEETPEVHPVLEDTGQQALVGRHLYALPAREAGHDGTDAFFHGRAVRRAVDVAQLGFGDLRIALVDTVLGPAVGEEVLRRGDDLAALEDALVGGRALEPAHHRADLGGDGLRDGR